MKIALLHYWLTNIRGGEKVFLDLCKMFPEADIFTHVISPDVKKEYFANRRVLTSFINKLPYAEKLYKNYMPLMFKAAQSFDLRGYDLIISSESGPIKGIRKPEGAKHICYCHTPMRYLWDMYDNYYQNAPFYKKCAMKLLKDYLRNQDLKSASCVDLFVSNSNFVKDRIRRIYDREAKVIYPPVELDYFSPNPSLNKSGFYLMAGELVKYKRPDIAVSAFNNSDRKLVVAGGGEELHKLKRLASKNIEFRGRVNDSELKKLYCEAKALIFPGIEDFGIVPVESQASGTPVIAFAGGGALETTIDGKTGIFFETQTSQALNLALDQFEKDYEYFSSEIIRQNTKKFSKERFRKEFLNFLTK